MVKQIAAAELRDRIDAGEELTVVDTRDKASFESWRVPGAIRYRFTPGSDLNVEDFRDQTGLDPEDPIATICAKGVSSRAFAEALSAAGYENVTGVEGGMTAWSSVYDVVDVPVGDAIDVVQFQRRAKGCLSYLVGDPETGTAAVVDPTRHLDQYERVARDRDYDIAHVLDTHVHADHISGGRVLADRLGGRYYLSDAADERDVQYDYYPLERNEVVAVGEVDLKAVSTPGHTAEAVSYLVNGNAVLTGDTLFVDSVGRTELQFGAGEAEYGARLLYRSLQGTILAQPDDSTILPGHFALGTDGTASIEHGEPVSATVRALRTGLPLVQMDEADFVTEVTRSLQDRPANYEKLIAINTGHERPADESEAGALETGPNNCAATSR